jgi:hypothetical protein
MPLIKERFRNIILCEDIREEVGNKKSLMGVLAGDIIVAAFPATLNVAVYFEYVPDKDDGNEFAIEFRLWQDDEELAVGKVRAPIEPGKVVTLVLPRALSVFEKAKAFRMTVKRNGEEEFELLNKKVLAPTS